MERGGSVGRTGGGSRRAGRALWLAVLLGGAAWIGQAQASENAASLYLLGSGGPGAALMPPLQGVFFDNIAYFYSGSGGAGAEFPVGGNLVAGVRASIPADFATTLWVPSTDILGGTLALGVLVPFGAPNMHVDAVLAGPAGQRFTFAGSQSNFVVGDPVLTGMLGWKVGKNTFIQASTLVNLPVGDYREGELANLAFHRWAGDVSLAATWRDEQSGWDVSGKLGVTFNGTNDSTHYMTGTESHYEAAVEKTLSPSWSVGLQAYYFYQLTGDSGSGALLGPFKGRVAGVGGTVNWKVKAGKIPLNVRVRGMHEFDATNRLEGDSLWLDVTMPLWVKLPPGAGAGH